MRLRERTYPERAVQEDMGKRNLRPDVFFSGLDQLELLRVPKIKRVESLRF